MRAEVGYVVYPFQIGPLNLSFNINMAQYYKEDGLNGQRFELNSQMSNTLGGTIKLTQSLSAHAIFYNLEKTSPYDDISHREMIHYNSKVFMKLYKRTEKYFQIVEPFVEGDFISVNGNPPILRESDLIDNTALIRTGVYSRVNGKNISFEGRIAQLYDFKARGQWNKLYPTLIEAKASFWKISLGFDSYQNITKKRIERLNSWLNFSPDESTSISLSQRYTRHGAVIPLFLWSMTLREQYSLYDSAQGIKTLGMNFFKKLSEKWSFSLNTNYDLKGAGLRDSSLHLRYAEKCWASNITLTRRPIFRNGRETSEFNFIIFFELKGMGAIKPPMDFLRK